MRSLLVISLGVLLIALFIGRGEAICSTMNPCVEELGQGKPFQEPDQVDAATNNVIVVGVDIVDLQYGWLNLKRRVYNGKVTGATWNVQKGQVLNVTLVNHLSDLNNVQDKQENQMNRPNTTNMHTHGVHISANPPEDSVLVSVDPGGKFDYQYHFHEQHPSGSFWYHAHIHGSTMVQVQSGMGGFLIIKDDHNVPYQLEDVSCPHHCEADIQMMFQGILQYANGLGGFAKMQDEIGDDPYFMQYDTITSSGQTLREWLEENVNFMTVNGLLQPVLQMEQGKPYRFRLLNGAGYDAIEAFITTKGTNQSTNACKIREIAYDGIYLDRPRELHQGQSFLAPGNRVDWMVRCDTPGQYQLRSYADPKNKMSTGNLFRFNGLLLTINVNPDSHHHGRDQILQQLGVEVDDSARKRDYDYDFDFNLPARPSFVGDLRNIPEDHIKQRFVVEFATGFTINRAHWTAADNFRYAMTVDTMQEWHIVSTDHEDGHPFHLHVNSFQIVSYNAYTGGFSALFDPTAPLLYNQDDNQTCHYQQEGRDILTPLPSIPPGTLQYLGHEQRYAANAGNTLAYARVGDWRDTLLVPPLANITIRFMPDRYVCPVIIHCHILAHEDRGMMMITKIVGKGESLDANIKSGDAYPGTCRECDRYPFNNPERLCDRQSSQAIIGKRSSNTNGAASGAAQTGVIYG